MRLEAIGHVTVGVESAVERAAAFLVARGYRRVRSRTPGAAFRRGSMLGSVLGITPDRWKARALIIPVGRSELRLVFEANDLFQFITDGERAFWGAEIAGVLQAIEKGKPSAVDTRQDRLTFVAGTGLTLLTAIFLTTVAGAALAAAAWGVVNLLLPQFGLTLPWILDPIWVWVVSGALVGINVGFRGVNGVQLQDFFSGLAGGPVPEGESLPARSEARPGVSDVLEAVVVVLDRDFQGRMDFVHSLVNDWDVSADVPVCVVIDPASADRSIAEERATRQLVIAGVPVDRARFDYACFETMGGAKATVVTQWVAPEDSLPARGAGGREPRRRRRIETFDAGYKFAARLGGTILIAFGFWPTWDGLSRGRALVATDSTRPLHLVVEKKDKVAAADVFGDLRVYGRVEETGEPADVGVFRKDFDAAAAGQRLEVYRTQPGQPIFVFRRKYDESWPVVRLPGLPFSWQFGLGLAFFGIGLGVFFSRGKPKAATRRF